MRGSPKNAIDTAEASGRRSDTDGLFGDDKVIRECHSVCVLFTLEGATTVGDALEK